MVRPDLARCLRAFEGELSAASSNMSCVTDIDYGRINTAVRVASRSDEEADKWIHFIKKGVWDAMIALLLSVVPNIEELGLSTILDGRDPSLTNMMLNRAFDLQNQAEVFPLAMAALRKVYLSLWSPVDDELVVDSLMPFLRLKSLSSCHIENTSFMTLWKGGLKEFQSTLTIKDLTFTTFYMNYAAMTTFFQCFSYLERLYYQYDVSGERQAPLQPPLLMPALFHLKSCLKEITIVNEGKRGSIGLESHPIGSFATFTKLTSITADAYILIGDPVLDDSNNDGYNDHDDAADGIERSQRLIDALPRTLEHLSIRRCQKNIVPHLFELVSQKTSYSPSLQSLNLDWETVSYSNRPKTLDPDIHPEFTREEVARLTAECNPAAITITIKHPPP